jgi:RNA polymerase subunit RPABC4/transcription elongation factor Spt4
MGIIRCRECDRTISDRAAVCPNCGAPQARGSARDLRWSLGVGIVLVIGSWLIGRGDAPPETWTASDMLFWTGLAVAGLGVAGRFARHSR